MGFFENAHNFEVNGGQFIDIRGGQMQYTMNSSMNIAGNNNRAAMYPSFSPGAQHTAYNAPRYGPTQSSTSTYPGYPPTSPPPTDPSYSHPQHTDPHASYPNQPHINRSYNQTTYPAAEQQNEYYQYQTSQFMHAQYQTGPQPHPYQPGHQSYLYPQRGQRSYPYHYPSQPGQQQYNHPPHHEQQPYHYPPQQQTTTTINQYQQVFHNSTADPQHHLDTGSPPPLDPEDPDVAEIRRNLERQDLS
ncbi:hypothetical protein Agabi119p4_5607 [Agaricus bisporus var. burnettii]|uniref:Uncharacterized protein n=1 Tax=Agaricus bisporus var. burnettii TaxID=192524 RepID=A0A8H7KGB8_AGABI|nr:hypothetical protein Agabi119p4_5607 [Agaricus bisporus var. burnettii]